LGQARETGADVMQCKICVSAPLRVHKVVTLNILS